MEQPQAANGPGRPQRRRHHLGVGAIAVFKLFKAALLLAAAIGLLKLMDRDLSGLVEHWATALRLDPDNRYLHVLLEKLAGFDPHRLKAVSVGSFFYSALSLTEGLGLWFEQRWAEYLTVIGTSCFVPLELYHLAHRFSLLKLAVLALNLLIVGYLVGVLRRGRTAT